jgi:hypothetical protein
MSSWKSPSHVILVAATPDITSELKEDLSGGLLRDFFSSCI